MYKTTSDDLNNAIFDVKSGANGDLLSSVPSLEVYEMTSSESCRKKIRLSKNIFKVVLEVDLKMLSSEHPIGHTVLLIYEQKQTLFSTCQSHLVTIIFTYFLYYKDM